MVQEAGKKHSLAKSGSQWLFWTCFIALIATSFGFIIRNQVIGEWQMAFNLSETQKGELFGVGLWPFSISIILFSLVIDKIGYGRALWFAFICHVSSVFITIFANGYWMLWTGTFILALGNGTVEAVINPVVATVFSKEKTKWLNILHAGWPGGMVLGGLLILLLIPDLGWKWKVALLIIPAAIYGFLLLKAQFPVQERVKAGVPYKEMLQEAGVIGAAIVVLIIFAEFGRVFSWTATTWLIISAVLIVAYGLYVRSLGRVLFIFLVLIMIPLATTELGTDSWITDLMKSIMGETSKAAGYIIVYTAFIMMVLRFLAGPIVERLKPLGLLAVSSLIAIIGLVFLSKAAGFAIFIAATIYALGKTFFWPTMLGVVSERFPKGGALTINAISGVGMLCVGIIGATFLGYFQDTKIDERLNAQNKDLHSKIVTVKKTSIFGGYNSLDESAVEALNGQVEFAHYKQVVSEKIKSNKGQEMSDNELADSLINDKLYNQKIRRYFELTLTPEEKNQVVDVKKVAINDMLKSLKEKGVFVDSTDFEKALNDKKDLDEVTLYAKKNTLLIVAIFPTIMLICYLILILYFRAKGGYKPVELEVQKG